MSVPFPDFGSPVSVLLGGHNGRLFTSRGRLCWLRSGFVEDLANDGGSAHAVSEHMVGAEIERCLAVRQPVDQGDVPGRAVGLKGQGFDQAQKIPGPGGCSPAPVPSPASSDGRRRNRDRSSTKNLALV